MTRSPGISRPSLTRSQLAFRTATRGGTRDFASISQIVATKYEVLIEHSLVARARGLVAGMPAGGEPTL